MVECIGHKRTPAVIVLFAAVAAISIFSFVLYGNWTLTHLIVGLALMGITLAIRLFIGYLQRKNMDARGRDLLNKKVEYVCIFIPAFVTSLFFIYNAVAIYLNGSVKSVLGGKIILVNVLIFVAAHLIIYAITSSFRLTVLIQSALWVVLCLFVFRDIADINLEGILLLATPLLSGCYCFILMIAREKRYVYYQRDLTSGRRPYRAFTERIIALIVAAGLIFLSFYLTVDTDAQSLSNMGNIVNKLIEFRDGLIN